MTTLDDAEAAGRLADVVWEYVAAADACEVGLALHGRRLETLAAVYELLPGFGENPACARRPCACTALPVRQPSLGGNSLARPRESA